MEHESDEEDVDAIFTKAVFLEMLGTAFVHEDKLRMCIGINWKARDVTVTLSREGKLLRCALKTREVRTSSPFQSTLAASSRCVVVKSHDSAAFPIVGSHP